MPAPLHKDQRGFFQELYHFNHDEPHYAQVSWFSIEPNTKRGGHYHRRTTELFVVLEGTVEYVTGHGDHQLRWQLQQGDVVRSKLGEFHAFETKDLPAKVLVFSSHHFNPGDTDTYIR
jgi:quercetin dioxygenase-like cupin family protein